MIKRNRCLSILMMAMVFFCSLGFTVLAHDVPNEARKGSITINMRYKGEPVSGGTLTLFKVGDVSESDGNYSFVLSKDFADSNAPLDDLESTSLPGKLEDYAKLKGLKGSTLKIDNAGKVVFKDLSLGVYLAVQNKAAKGYSKAASFLVTVPMHDEDGNYLYDVDASPKVEIDRKEPTPPGPPGNPPKGDTPPPRLPQTGQLNWPIPVMAITGLLLFAVGWMIRSRKEKDGHEK